MGYKSIEAPHDLKQGKTVPPCDQEPLRHFDADLNSWSMAVAGDHADLTAAWKQCVSSFIDDIGSGRPLPRGDSALAVHEIIDQVYRRRRTD